VPARAYPSPERGGSPAEGGRGAGRRAGYRMRSHPARFVYNLQPLSALMLRSAPKERVSKHGAAPSFETRPAAALRMRAEEKAPRFHGLREWIKNIPIFTLTPFLHRRIILRILLNRGRCHEA
jgi:hypothetical protein